MKYLLLALLLIAPTETLAAGKTQTRKPNSGQGQDAHVLQMDEDFPIEELEEEGITTHPLSEMGKSSSGVLPPSVQDQFFRDSGLSTHISGWDGFEQDRLAQRCEHLESREVFEKYESKIPLSSIQKFKAMVKKYRAEEARR